MPINRLGNPFQPSSARLSFRRCQGANSYLSLTRSCAWSRGGHRTCFASFGRLNLRQRPVQHLSLRLTKLPQSKTLTWHRHKTLANISLTGENRTPQPPSKNHLIENKLATISLQIRRFDSVCGANRQLPWQLKQRPWSS